MYNLSQKAQAIVDNYNKEADKILSVLNECNSTKITSEMLIAAKNKLLELSDKTNNQLKELENVSNR